MASQKLSAIRLFLVFSLAAGFFLTIELLYGIIFAPSNHFLILGTTPTNIIFDIGLILLPLPSLFFALMSIVSAKTARKNMNITLQELSYIKWSLYVGVYVLILVGIILLYDAYWLSAFSANWTKSWSES